MGNYTSVANVEGRLPGRPVFGASTPITLTQVGEWIDEAEAEVDGELAAQGFAVPITAARGLLVLRLRVAAGVAGRCERHYSSGTDNTQRGHDLLAEFAFFIQRIQIQPAIIGKMLLGSAATQLAAASHWTDNPEGDTEEGGDFGAVIKRFTAW